MAPGAALLVFTPASMLAGLLIHPTDCYRPGDTRGLGQPETRAGCATGLLGRLADEHGAMFVWRSFVNKSRGNMTGPRPLGPFTRRAPVDGGTASQHTQKPISFSLARHGKSIHADICSEQAIIINY